MTRRITSAAAFVCAMLPAMPAVAQDTRAFLELVINGVTKEHVLVVMRPHDALVDEEALRRSGIERIGGRRETLSDVTLVSLSSLAPEVVYRIEERELRLVLTVEPDLLGRVVRDMEAGAPPDLEYRRATSLFTNYSVTGGPGQPSELFTESALSVGGLLLSTTATTAGRGTVRGISSVTIDQRTALRRWVIGDTFATGGPLGGDAQIAGLSVSREFSLAPYFVRHPTLSMSALLQTESTVEVYVNGRLVSQEQVPPGQLDLRNLPLSTGHNDTRVIVRDPFGNTQELTTRYYLTSSVLAPGLHDYQYSVGWRRSGFGTQSWAYGEPLLLARHRIGMTDRLTLGARIEADRRVLGVGSTANIRIPVGEIEAALAASRSGRTGAAGQVSYQFSGQIFGAGASLRHSIGPYATVATSGRLPVPPTELSVFAAMPLGGGSSLTVQYGRAGGPHDSRQSTLSLQGSARLGQMLSLVAGGTRFDRPTGRGLEASVGLTMTLGSRTVATASTLHTAGETRGIYDLQRSLAAGPGLGYQFRAESGPQSSISGAVQYQSPYGRYELRRDVSGSAGHTTLNASGAVVAVGGRLYASRAVRSSFALVRVPGVTDVRGFSSNQEIGRTDRRGDLLVPDLLPYYGNKLQISDSDIPLEYVVSDVDVTLAPPYRGGAVVLFPVRRVQQTVGRVVVADANGQRVPAFADVRITVDGETLSSPIGRDGEFYFENLPPGEHPAHVVEAARSCSFTIHVPASVAVAVELGTVTCR